MRKTHLLSLDSLKSITHSISVCQEHLEKLGTEFARVNAYARAHCRSNYAGADILTL